jgi:hypothetical protein
MLVYLVELDGGETDGKSIRAPFHPPDPDLLI